MIFCQISKKDLDFQQYKIEDLEELEKINAYPPRFFLTFRNNDSIQNLSTKITVRIGKLKDKPRPKHGENEILDFPINTVDYKDFVEVVRVPPSDKSGTVCRL